MLHVVQFSHIIHTEQPLQQTKSWGIFTTFGDRVMCGPLRFLFDDVCQCHYRLGPSPLGADHVRLLVKHQLGKPPGLAVGRKKESPTVHPLLSAERNWKDPWNTKVMRTWNSLATPWCVYLELPCDSLKTTSETCTVKLGNATVMLTEKAWCGVFIRVWMKLVPKSTWVWTLKQHADETVQVFDIWFLVSLYLKPSHMVLQCFIASFVFLIHQKMWKV